MKTLWLPHADSTNTWLRENAGRVEPMTLVVAREQTAGRGQRGNSWESEPGRNLTFSFYFAPEGLRPSEQFAVSEAVSLAMVSVLRHFGIEAEVKWPNDIYVGERKIAGILIENSIMGSSIARCIVGIGLNVNQKKFLSDAPNPVSMTMLTRETYSLNEVLEAVEEEMDKLLGCLGNGELLHEEYKSLLWRSRGEHPFIDAASRERFMAVIEDVEKSGHLVVRLSESGEKRKYAFKEVIFEK